MCGSMVHIQSATAEIRRGKKKKIDRKKPQGKNIMSPSAMQGGHNNALQLVSPLKQSSVKTHKLHAYCTVSECTVNGKLSATEQFCHSGIHMNHNKHCDPTEVLPKVRSRVKYNTICLQCLTLLFGWQEGLPACKIMVGCWRGLERGAELHMAHLMPLPPTVSCFSKIQIGF